LDGSRNTLGGDPVSLPDFGGNFHQSLVGACWTASEIIELAARVKRQRVFLLIKIENNLTRCHVKYLPEIISGN